MNATTALIAKIKALPNTMVSDRRTDNGLGSISIYETLPNGVSMKSIWIGRPTTEDQLVDYIAERRAPKVAGHTPAPWVIKDQLIVSAHPHHIDGQAMVVAKCVYDHESDAALIAAAPELLQWATEYTSQPKDGESGNDYAIRMDAAFNGLRAAIAKATGGAL